MEPIPPPVQLGEITEQDLKLYDGSDPKKPVLMAIKGQIYDVTPRRMYYGLGGGPYATNFPFAGKNASRALALLSSEDKDLTGDLSGLSAFDLDTLQDWENEFMNNFMSQYVKVGTIKKTAPVVNGPSRIETSDSHVAQPAEASPSESTAPVENGDHHYSE